LGFLGFLPPTNCSLLRHQLPHPHPAERDRLADAIPRRHHVGWHFGKTVRPHTLLVDVPDPRTRTSFVSTPRR
jgi:hypothetical protein